MEAIIVKIVNLVGQEKVREFRVVATMPVLFGNTWGWDHCIKTQILTDSCDGN